MCASSGPELLKAKNCKFNFKSNNWVQLNNIHKLIPNGSLQANSTFIFINKRPHLSSWLIYGTWKISKMVLLIIWKLRLWYWINKSTFSHLCMLISAVGHLLKHKTTASEFLTCLPLDMPLSHRPGCGKLQTQLTAELSVFCVIPILSCIQDFVIKFPIVNTM